MGLAGRAVIVVGAGIGGAATALVLARAGARVTLVEKIAEPRAVGAGILLQPNGLAVLYGLGLEAALRAVGHASRHATVADPSGRAILVSPVPDFGSGLDHVLILRRSELRRVLLDAVDAHPGVTTRFGADVTAAHADGSILANGDARRADLVVGADGVHSIVRSTGRFGVRAREGTWYLRGLSDAPGTGALVEYWTPLGIFGGGPVSGGWIYFYASTGAPAVSRALGWLRDRALTIAGRLADSARAVRASQQEDPAQVRAFVTSLATRNPA